MPAPDLKSEEGRRAYGLELAGVAKPWRWGGLSLVVLAVIGAAINRNSGGGMLDTTLGQLSAGVFLIGCALAVIAIVKRARYHHARLSGKDS